MNKQFRIEPSEGNPEPVPPSGGLWIRDEAGGLRPADRATADVAGLAWPEAEAPADGGAVEAVTTAETEAKKRAR